MAFLAPIAAPVMAVGTLVSAMGAMNAGQSNAAQEYRKTQLALSSNTARAAASGVNPGFGSPVANAGKIAKWGTYNQLMDIYNGKTQATGLQDQAQADIYGGQQAASAGMWGAGGTLLSGGASLLKAYG